MKILLILLLANSCFASIKNISFNFDSSRIKKEIKNDCVLFGYDDSACKYVEFGDGSPVLPCKHIYVVMPKGAKYVKSNVMATKSKLKGFFKLFTRKPISSVAQSARVYPANVIEFVSQYDKCGFRIFKFRAFPLACQPADKSVYKINNLKVVIEYEIPGGDGSYKNVDLAVVAKMRRAVINPADFNDYVAKSNDPLANVGSNNRQIFITDSSRKEKNISNASRRPANDGAIDIIKNNFSISDGGVMFTPLQF